MGFSQSSLFAKVALVSSIIGALILVIGFATVSWLTREINGISSNIGLFSTCTSAQGITQCVSTNTLTALSWYEAVRAFEIIAFLVAVGLIVVLIVWIFIKSDMKILGIVALALAFVAAACVFIGVIIFGAEATDFLIVYNLGWSFALTCVSGIIFIITGGFLVVDKVKSQNE